MARSQILHLVDVAGIKKRLELSGTPEETVEEFYRFGTLLFSELQQRGAEVVRKLTNTLGWSIAVLGFLLLDQQSRIGRMGRYGLIGLAVAITLAIACAVAAAIAGKSRMWRAPSEADWFCSEIWDDPKTLKCHHIISMLETHQDQAGKIKIKAEFLRFIEIGLLLTGAAIVCSLIFLSS
jgi:hypothetical protein